MSPQDRKEMFEQLGRALDRLKEALSVPPEIDSLAQDAAIQRFEFTYELLWKAVKRAAEENGLFPKSPREAFQMAYRLEWIDEESLWLDLLDARNKTVHTYEEPLAKEIYKRVQKYYPAMRQLYILLERRSG